MMPVLKEAHGPDEDWSGLKDAKARRKLQNRLNVRAHRRRKAINSAIEAHTESNNSARHKPYSLVQQYIPLEENGTRQRKPLKLKLLNERIASDSPGFFFPLTSDHLITLVQYNFVRGVLTNMAILGIQNAFPPECSRHWVGMPLFPAPSGIPESLQPTALQLSTPHEPWIDLIPDKQMRDNTILLIGVVTREDVEDDVTGLLFGKVKLLEMTGMLAWDTPWDTNGWELTEGFIKKWPLLVKGCWKLLESTNRWRAMRDEEPLVVDL
ncbi:uncharacterized protein GGS22DRAFT_156597 [Annulohypoxylon maeteangense]|uniref:uncharacterized protein n=1 Tax=Annulohypoxylon maeteangense TaxID=1927788 RepID=UPI002008365B|nr:uncharacterized protein GGS22DRAFT_156597 [Annulohypoxylon maeteangense]KAI0887273.1 hypothetical protein GGS22DRAFT_156597 [Annulohypoxylon maeteangense]